jgi:nitroimidazol reductase NimA-like FMN-containing flavoprotein (pyridoxamine 5'-phosphate oxidase superfamily)
MDAPDSITMDDEEREEFLGTGGTGVISFASGPEESPHSVPVSYGYDPAESVFYFRLATDGDSDKGELTDRPVTFVTYREVDGAWGSVVASGRLERTTDPEVATETLEGLERVDLPLADMFGRPVAEVQFEFHRLVPDSLTGRVESSPAP